MTAILTRGEDVVLDITIRNDAGDPFDLTDKVVSIKAKVSTGTLTTYSSGVSVVNAEMGKLTWSLSDTETEAFKVGNLDFDVYLTEGAETRIVKFRNQLTVEDRLR